VEFDDAVDSAPPGWRQFAMADVARLPDGVRAHELARVPPGESGERIVRGLFWTLVYHLDAGRWDELASHEPIAPEILDALPHGVDSALDVGAGSGRLTRHLVSRARSVTAVEPSDPLRALLSTRYPTVTAVSAWAEALPFEAGSFSLTAACGAFGPDPSLIAELAA